MFWPAGAAPQGRRGLRAVRALVLAFVSQVNVLHCFGTSPRVQPNTHFFPRRTVPVIAGGGSGGRPLAVFCVLDDDRFQLRGAAPNEHMKYIHYHLRGTPTGPLQP